MFTTPLVHASQIEAGTAANTIRATVAPERYARSTELLQARRIRGTARIGGRLLQAGGPHRKSRCGKTPLPLVIAGGIGRPETKEI